MQAFRTLNNIEQESIRKRALFSLLGAYYADDAMNKNIEQKGMGTRVTWMQTSLLDALTRKHNGKWMCDDCDFSKIIENYGSITRSRQLGKEDDLIFHVARMAPWAFVLRNLIPEVTKEFVFHDIMNYTSSVGACQYAYIYVTILKAIICNVSFEDIIKSLEQYCSDQTDATNSPKGWINYCITTLTLQQDELRILAKRYKTISGFTKAAQNLRKLICPQWKAQIGNPKPAFALLVAALFAFRHIVDKNDYCAEYNRHIFFVFEQEQSGNSSPKILTKKIMSIPITNPLIMDCENNIYNTFLSFISELQANQHEISSMIGSVTGAFLGIIQSSYGIEARLGSMEATQRNQMACDNREDWFELVAGTRLGNLLMAEVQDNPLVNGKPLIRPSIMIEAFDILYDQTERMTDIIVSTQSTKGKMPQTFTCDGEPDFDECMDKIKQIVTEKKGDPSRGLGIDPSRGLGLDHNLDHDLEHCLCLFHASLAIFKDQISIEYPEFLKFLAAKTSARRFQRILNCEDEFEGKHILRILQAHPDNLQRNVDLVRTELQMQNKGESFLTRNHTCLETFLNFIDSQLDLKNGRFAYKNIQSMSELEKNLQYYSNHRVILNTKDGVSYGERFSLGLCSPFAIFYSLCLSKILSVSKFATKAIPDKGHFLTINEKNIPIAHEVLQTDEIGMHALKKFMTIKAWNKDYFMKRQFDLSLLRQISDDYFIRRMTLIAGRTIEMDIELMLQLSARIKEYPNDFIKDIKSNNGAVQLNVLMEQKSDAQYLLISDRIREVREANKNHAVQDNKTEHMFWEWSWAFLMRYYITILAEGLSGIETPLILDDQDAQEVCQMSYAYTKWWEENTQKTNLPQSVAIVMKKMSSEVDRAPEYEKWAKKLEIFISSTEQNINSIRLTPRLNRIELFKQWKEIAGSDVPIGDDNNVLKSLRKVFLMKNDDSEFFMENWNNLTSSNSNHSIIATIIIIATATLIFFIIIILLQ